jgi:hypothetical protein
MPLQRHNGGVAVLLTGEVIESFVLIGVISAAIVVYGMISARNENQKEVVEPVRDQKSA